VLEGNDHKGSDGDARALERENKGAVVVHRFTLQGAAQKCNAIV
jgi:hypothetical protein